MLAAPEWLFEYYHEVANFRPSSVWLHSSVFKGRSRVLSQPLGLATLRYEGEGVWQLIVFCSSALTPRNITAGVSPCSNKNNADPLEDVKYSLPMLDHELKEYTLWAENDKLYGHSNDVVALAVSHDERYLASACRARTYQDSSVYIWDLLSPGVSSSSVCSHSLTITSIKFSSNDDWILTVSRDRSWSLLSRSPDTLAPYALEVRHEKAHAKMITDCQWIGAEDMFATVGKDCAIKLWALSSDNRADSMRGWANILSLQMDAQLMCVDITSLSACPEPEEDKKSQEMGPINNIYLAALGYADGRVDLAVINSLDVSIRRLDTKL